MDDADAVDALEELGLTSYEARVFVALQKLGVGSASDVDRIADVPRSQVYGAAEKLADRGLLELQQSNPIRYRPVALAEARERLRDRHETQADRAFEYLEAVQSEHAETDGRQEAVWTLRGRDSTERRAIALIEAAGETVVYGGGPETLSESVADALRDRASAGVTVTVVSSEPTVLARFDGEAVTTCDFPAELAPDERRGRILVVDGETILLSTLDGDSNTETAIWSAETGFAATIIRLVDSWLGEYLDR
jgi:sugar-specific transcriptional regulator TrmB